jgi:hypothetical protein
MTAIKPARLRLLIIKAPEIDRMKALVSSHGNRYAVPSLSAIA